MRAQDELKNKLYHNNNPIKLQTSTNYQPRIISKSRENQKNLNHSSKNKPDNKSTQFYQYSTCKAIKRNCNKNLNTNKNSHQTSPIQDNNHGILISVNLQQVLTPRNLHNLQKFQFSKEDSTPKTQKNYLLPNQSKKNPKPLIKTQYNFIDFQCNEELSYTRRASPGPRQKTLSRNRRQLIKEGKSHIKTEQKLKEKILSPYSKPINFQQQMRKFEQKIEQINSNNNVQSLVFLDTIQKTKYRLNPYYIQQSQPNFTRKMRLVLVQWMMQVADQFGFQRQTFHISVNLIDRYLQKEKNLNRGAFQAVGAASLYIASKMEQFAPRKSDQFVICTAGHTTSAKLKQMQVKILKVLNFNINPPTLVRWANRLMVQWDLYINVNSEAKLHPLFALRPKIYFKQVDQSSYVNYRRLIQLIDCSLLNIQTAQYHPKLLVCSFMYLYLGMCFQYFIKDQVVQEFPYSSQYLFDEENLFNDIFNQFIMYTFGMMLQDLLPSIQYCAQYFKLQENLDMPTFVSSNADQSRFQNMVLEQYESYQTFDAKMFLIAKKIVEQYDKKFK